MRRLAREVIERFSEHRLGDYSFIIFTLKKQDRDYFTRIGGETGLNITISEVGIPVNSFYDGLSGELKERIKSPVGVLHFLGKDFLSMKIEESGEEWNIHGEDESNVKFALVEKLLEGFKSETKSIWINLATGVHRRSEDGEIYCNTRYGLAGFEKIKDLTPHLKNLEIINICLNYFMRTSSSTDMEHCRHCVPERIATQRILTRREEELPKYIRNKIDELS